MHELCLRLGPLPLWGFEGSPQGAAGEQGGWKPRWLGTQEPPGQNHCFRQVLPLFPPSPCPLPPQFFQAAGKLLYILRGTISGVSPNAKAQGHSQILIWQTTVAMEKDLGVKSRAQGNSRSPHLSTGWAHTRRASSVWGCRPPWPPGSPSCLCGPLGCSAWQPADNY